MCHDSISPLCVSVVGIVASAIITTTTVVDFAVSAEICHPYAVVRWISQIGNAYMHVVGKTHDHSAVGYFVAVAVRPSGTDVFNLSYCTIKRSVACDTACNLVRE